MLWLQPRSGPARGGCRRDLGVWLGTAETAGNGRGLPVKVRFSLKKMPARSAAKNRHSHVPEAFFTRKMIYQTPATCNHHGLRQGTDLTLSLLVTHISSRPSRSSCTKTKPYQTSATGHIDFLEFANAAALPFACNPCNMLDEATSYRFYNCKHHPLERVHARTPRTTRHPAFPPYPSTQPARPARERVKRAFAASH